MSSIKDSQYDILRKPRITEKAATLNSYHNCVVFDVHTSANKVEIKEAVEKIFDVKVSKVRTANFMGKLKRRGVRSTGMTKSWRKAYVYLEQGQTVDIMEGL